MLFSPYVRFDECPISPSSLKGIKEAGYEKMTKVQEATLPLILKGMIGYIVYTRI
jgi:superfamily II DNA/RNA helicase